MDLLELVETQILFPRPRLSKKVLDGVALRVGARVVHLEPESGVRLYGWHRVCGARRVVLLHHGNAETVLDRLALQDLLLDWGWDVFTYAYRGYPGSTGTPSEEGLKRDAVCAWRFLTSEAGYDPSRVVVHGKSLGGGVSALLAEVHPPARLVMESTFTSILDVVRSRLPLIQDLPVLTNRFETCERAPRLGLPTLVLHGDDDRVVPVEQGRRLATLFPDAQYVECAGAGHGESLPAVESAARSAYRAFLGNV